MTDQCAICSTIHPVGACPVREAPPPVYYELPAEPNMPAPDPVRLQRHETMSSYVQGDPHIYPSLQPEKSGNASNPAAAPSTTIVINAVIPHTTPTAVHCPYCRRLVTTTVKETSGALAWLCCLGMLVGGCWPCCLLPFLICPDYEHYCPLCKRLLARYQRV